MLRRVTFFALFALLIVPAQAATITFTGVSGSPGSGSFDGPLAALGVTITVTGGTAVVVSPAGAPGVITNPSLAGNTTGNTGPGSVTRVDFASGALNNTISIAVWDTETGAPRVSLTTYTAGNVAIQTVTLTSESGILNFTTLGTAGYLLITDTGGDGHVWDTLTFTEAAVPEPATFAMFGTALVGLGLLRRRKS